MRRPVTIDDDRLLNMSEHEAEVQASASHKDVDFRLSGPWKAFLRVQDGIRVYEVDGNWVRANLCVMFGHGGHGLVHEFIRNDEVWVATRHCEGCDCVDLPSPDAWMGTAYRDSTIVHEIRENALMRAGATFEVAHEAALAAERAAGFIEDPYRDPGARPVSSPI